MINCGGSIAEAETCGVYVESQLAYVVKGKALQDVLQIENASRSRGVIAESGKQAGVNLQEDVFEDEVAERFGVELVAGGFPLQLPEVAVGVEDALPQKVSEKANEAVAFRVVVEVGLQHVLHVQRVGGDDAVDLAGPPEYGGVGGAAAEDFSGPLQEPMAVLQEFWKDSQDGVDFEPWPCG